MTKPALQRISPGELEWLAQGTVPPVLQHRHAPGALPPAFVARRSLGLLKPDMPQHLSGAIYYIVAADQQIVGTCGFKDAGDEGWVEVGYGVAPTCQGRGIGTQAVHALCCIAFGSGSIQAVRACIEPDNAASSALARKLGFVAGSPVIEEDGTCVLVWTLLASGLPAQVASASSG